MRTLIVDRQEEGLRLDNFLLRYMDAAGKSFLYKMFRKKNIKLNGAKVQGNERLAAGDEIVLYLADETIQKFQKGNRFLGQQPAVGPDRTSGDRPGRETAGQDGHAVQKTGGSQERQADRPGRQPGASGKERPGRQPGSSGADRSGRHLGTSGPGRRSGISGEGRPADRMRGTASQASGTAAGHMPEVIYEDEDILVVNKPVGMLSQKADKNDDSLVDILTEYILQGSPADRKAPGQPGGDVPARRAVFKPGICNRLDRSTSGLIVAGKSIRGLQWMNRAFKERHVNKYYLCLVYGKIEEKKYLKGYLKKDRQTNTVRILKEQEPGTAEVETSYRPLGRALWRGHDITLLQVHLITGKTHQIRAHLASAGYPVLGDKKYMDAMAGQGQTGTAGPKADSIAREAMQVTKGLDIRRQMLHAWRLEWEAPSYLPERYHQLKLEGAPSRKFQEVLEKLGIEELIRKKDGGSANKG